MGSVQINFTLVGLQAAGAARSNAMEHVMGWHDDLAARSYAMGKTSPEFKAAARRKAKATWPWLLVAAAVWYFAGWPWALIPVAIVAFTAFQSVSASLVAMRLEKIESTRCK